MVEARSHSVPATLACVKADDKRQAVDGGLVCRVRARKQKRFMQAVAHSKEFADKVDVPQSVGEEFCRGRPSKEAIGRDKIAHVVRQTLKLAKLS